MEKEIKENTKEDDKTEEEVKPKKVRTYGDPIVRFSD